MKSLFWKEVHDLRLTGPLAALFTAVTLVMFAIYDYSSRRPDTVWRLDVNFGVISVVLVSIIAAVLVGAGQVSSEVGSGSMQFLSTLPLSRRQIWGVKMAVGAAAACCCGVGAVVGAVAVAALFDAAGRGPGLLHLIAQYLPIGWPILPILLVEVVLLGLALTIAYLPGLAVSALFDRPIAAAMAGLIVLAAAGAGLTYLSTWLNVAAGVTLGRWIFWWLAVACVVTLVRISYRTFTRGESLKTSKRFLESALGLWECLAWAVVIPVAAYLWLVWGAS